jgi:hypothetical protein
MTNRFPLRALALSALLLAGNLNAQITFSFEYTMKAGSAVNSGFLDPTLGAARQAALNSAATTLAGFFTTTAPVNLTFVVESETANTTTLASAGSGISGSAGFNQTVVQQKVISGTDRNGATADGNIFWNWHHPWDITDSVAGGAYDFKSTAMHEILHAFGFTSSTGAAGSNTGTAWNTFDQFLTTTGGSKLIDGTTFAFKTEFDSSLTGNGMRFNGANAMAANGGNLVQIYSPGTTWSDGSSGAHTADSIYANTMMISATSTGPGARTLTAIEQGILKDIGYTMSASAIPEPSTYAAILGAAALGVTVIRRRRRTAA